MEALLENIETEKYLGPEILLQGGWKAPQKWSGRMPGPRYRGCGPRSRSSARGRLPRPSSHAETADVLNVLAIPDQLLHHWERGWGLSGQKRTGSGMNTGLRADGGDRSGNAGL